MSKIIELAKKYGGSLCDNRGHQPWFAFWIPELESFYNAAKEEGKREAYKEVETISKDITRIVRMPNIEYVADAHNLAIDKLQNLVNSEQKST